jgi:hypothetical protein
MNIEKLFATWTISRQILEDRWRSIVLIAFAYFFLVIAVGSTAAIAGGVGLLHGFIAWVFFIAAEMRSDIDYDAGMTSQEAQDRISHLMFLWLKSYGRKYQKCLDGSCDHLTGTECSSEMSYAFRDYMYQFEDRDEPGYIIGLDPPAGESFTTKTTVCSDCRENCSPGCNCWCHGQQD